LAGEVTARETKKKKKNTHAKKKKSEVLNMRPVLSKDEGSLCRKKKLGYTGKEKKSVKKRASKCI